MDGCPPWLGFRGMFWTHEVKRAFRSYRDVFPLEFTGLWNDMGTADFLLAATAHGTGGIPWQPGPMPLRCNVCTFDTRPFFLCVALVCLVSPSSVIEFRPKRQLKKAGVLPFFFYPVSNLHVTAGNCPTCSMESPSFCLHAKDQMFKSQDGLVATSVTRRFYRFSFYITYSPMLDWKKCMINFAFFHTW